jgi:hypothetical protein
MMSHMYCHLVKQIWLFLFYLCKVPSVFLSIQCLTNYNIVVQVPAVAVVPSIIDNRVALRRELRVGGASYVLMCHELEGEHTVFLDENPGQKCDYLELAKYERGRVLHIPVICILK